MVGSTTISSPSIPSSSSSSPSSPPPALTLSTETICGPPTSAASVASASSSALSLYTSEVSACLRLRILSGVTYLALLLLGMTCMFPGMLARRSGRARTGRESAILVACCRWPPLGESVPGRARMALVAVHFFWWESRLLLSPKERPHFMQANGFSPVCVRTWDSKTCLWAKMRPQNLKSKPEVSKGSH